MKQLKKYLSKTISNTFFPIFLTLFSITSVIYLVKIASLTSVITINFKELLFLFSLTIPDILFYTLPVTFFLSIIINLSKLSNEYELIVITSFGLSPFKLLRLLIPVSLLMSISLFVISFILIPQADYIKDNFMNNKKQEAQFNIKASEYGQKFGPWYIYVQNKKEKFYNDIILYQPKKHNDTFIISKKATVKHNVGSLNLELYNGSASKITNKINQIDFNKMSINNELKKIKKISSLSDLIKYWGNTKKYSSKRRLILKNSFIALLPIISIIFYISFGYFNPRYEKNRNTIYAISLVILYMIITQKIATYREFYLLFTVPIVWLFISFLFYLKRIKPYY